MISPIESLKLVGEVDRCHSLAIMAEAVPIMNRYRHRRRNPFGRDDRPGMEPAQGGLVEGL